MKYALYSICLVFLLSGCDFLERTNPESQTESFFKKGEEEARQVVNAAYSCMQKNALYMRGIEIINAVRSDEGCITPNTSKMEENVVSLATYQNNSSEKMTEMLWRYLYDGIHKSNVAIERIPGMNLSEKAMSRLLGEAYFLRGFYNMHLVLYFGESIPLRDKPVASQADLEKGPAKDGELWSLIITDFEKSQSYFAEADYKNTSSDYEKGRANLGAATGYLGKASLYYAQWKLQGKGEAGAYYNRAASEFAKIIRQETGSYFLQPNYRANFTNASEYNNESLFEVGFAFWGTKVWEVDQDNTDCVEGNWLPMIGGMTSGCGKDAPRYWNYAPTRRLAREYESGDYRKVMTLWCEGGAWYKDKDAVYAYNTDNTGKESMNFPLNPFTKGENALYIGFRKYDYDFNHQQLEYVSQAVNGISDINVRVMRYADVLLMYAECLVAGADNVAGKSVSDCLGEVRSRANRLLTPSDDAYQYENGNKNLDYFVKAGSLPVAYTKSADMWVQIQHERMVELAGESHRYFDLQRWYRAGVLRDIDPASSTFGSTIASDAMLREKVIYESNFRGVFYLPIPQYELNTNPHMRPNEAN